MTNLNNYSEQQKREILATEASRRGFPEYCVAIDPAYKLEWFHQKIALRLEKAVRQVEQGEDVRLMIFMPPRHGKSDTGTQKLPSWALGLHPEWPFIVSSYSSELATDFGQGTRDLMDSSNYKQIFDTRLREDTTAKAKWMTEEGGGYTAVGVGGAITGRGFKFGIIDDPFKNREEADSPVTRESVHKWYRSTFYTRQEGNTAIILILTRWHDDDLAGRLLKEETEAEKAGEIDYDKWEVLEFKAIAEQDEPNRAKGEALWPHKFNLSKLLRTKSSIGSYEWSALYQQNPIDEENQEFKREWLQYRSMEEVLRMKTRKFATIDPAGSKHKKSDSTGVTRNWVNDLNEWNISSRRYRINSKGIIDLIFELHIEGFEQIGIEEGVYKDAIEPFLKEEMDERGLYPNIITLKHRGVMKETRIRGLIPRYENRKVYHIGNTCTDLEEEYLRFPKAAHDDCLDTTAYQNQIAISPASSEGDTVSLEQLLPSISPLVNSQQGNVIIGVSTKLPVSMVIGNKDGLFFNRTFTEAGIDPCVEIQKYVNKFQSCYIVSDQVGNVMGLKALQAKNPGKVFVAYMSSDHTSQNIIKWGAKNDFGDVELAKDQLTQILLGELQDKRLVLSGSEEDWNEYLQQFASLFRSWEDDTSGNKIATWSTSSPDGFVRATMFFRAGFTKFGAGITFVNNGSMFEGMPRAGDFDSFRAADLP